MIILLIIIKKIMIKIMLEMTIKNKIMIVMIKKVLDEIIVVIKE